MNNLLLPNREDFLGANFVTKIGAFIYGKINNMETYYTKNFPYQNSLYMKPLISNSKERENEKCKDKGNMVRQNQAWPVVQIKQDLISYFRENYKEYFYQILKEEAQKRNYKLPWSNSSKIICIHVRLYDDRKHHGSDYEDYDGRGSGNYIKDLIENDKVDSYSRKLMDKYASSRGFRWGNLSHSDKQVAIDINKLEKIIVKLKKDYPDKEIHIVTKLVKHQNNQKYLNIFKRYNLPVHSNNDYDYDLWLLIHSEILFLSKSTYSLISGYYHQGSKVYYPIWGTFVSCGLYTNYDKSGWEDYI